MILNQIIMESNTIDYSNIINDLEICKFNFERKTTKIPQDVVGLIFGSAYEEKDLEKISDLRFPKLKHLKLKSLDKINLRKWYLPSLEYLDIMNCKKCDFSDCHLPNLKYIYGDVTKNKSFKISKLSASITIIRYDPHKSCYFFLPEHLRTVISIIPIFEFVDIILV